MNLCALKNIQIAPVISLCYIQRKSGDFKEMKLENELILDIEVSNTGTEGFELSEY